jgi:hypothetical protein
MNRVHFTNIRLRVNAGINLPECKAHSARPLNMDASRLAMSGSRSEVTCKRCIALLNTHAFLLVQS